MDKLLTVVEAHDALYDFLYLTGILGQVYPLEHGKAHLCATRDIANQNIRTITEMKAAAIGDMLCHVYRGFATADWMFSHVSPSADNGQGRTAKP